MDLYDDLDAKPRPGQVDGWSSGIKLLQTQLQLKKAIVTAPVKKEPPKRASHLLAPTALLIPKNRPQYTNDLPYRNNSNDFAKGQSKTQTTITAQSLVPVHQAAEDFSWDVIDEYDPLWPNEYEKLVKERRERRDKERKARRHERKNESKPSGFGGRSDDAESYSKPSPARGHGAAIAPPPSLQESTPIIPPQNLSNTSGLGASSVAAKIMAKYGFRDGQGLGKKEQGMSVALQVEKTSKRGGRIIHENEFLPPSSSPPPPSSSASSSSSTPATVAMPPPALPPSTKKEEQTITEMMKAPSKVVMLRNMVGAGDVDEELEGEVKDECNTKYGDVVVVSIHEFKNAAPDEAVRIFVEFKRIESAIKAVVDLNGRFFGGRQVKAGFYPIEKFKCNNLVA